MAINTKLQGVTKSQEQESAKFYRDTRTMGQKFGGFISSDNAAAFPAGAIPLCYFMPGLSEIVLVACIWMYFYFVKVNNGEGLPYRLPASSGKKDPNNISPNGKVSNADGIMYLGNERDPDTNNEIWVSNSDARTHMLIFGTTGAGKTEALLGFAYNALLQGSGFIYVDGKGTNELYSKILTLVRTVGRDDDVLLINYMTGGNKDIGNLAIGTMLSNTVNPFATGSSSSISEFFTGLMSSGGGGDDMWAGRARTFITALVRVLTWMRDEGEIAMYVDEIRDYMELPKLVNLTAREDIPSDVKAALDNYVLNLPGMDANTLQSLKTGKPLQATTVYEQHGFITMQLTETMNLLADDYAHIFRAPMGEVDFFDVVANRRILVVLLPALEKSSASLGNLGKIIVAGLKGTMAASMGTEVEGMRSKIIDSRPTNAPTPYITILDEYGYYAVEGSAVMPAQARGLGFCMIFAGQDYPAFKKASPEEAASIVANTTIKICMKLEDPDETFEIFAKAAGESKVTQVGGFQQNIGATLNYTDIGTATIESQARINVRDLKRQGPGEAHILFGDQLARIRTFYTGADAAENTYVNSFLVIKTYVPDEVETVTIPENLMKVISGKEKLDDAGFASATECIYRLSSAYDAIENDKGHNSSPSHAGIYAMGIYQDFKEKLTQEMKDAFSDISAPEESEESSTQKKKTALLEKIKNQNSSDEGFGDDAESVKSKDSTAPTKAPEQEPEPPKENDANSLLDEEVSGLQNDLGLNQESTLMDLAEIDRLAGVPTKKAEDNSSNTMKQIKENIDSYKIEPEPKRRAEVASDILGGLEDFFADE